MLWAGLVATPAQTIRSAWDHAELANCRSGCLVDEVVLAGHTSSLTAGNIITAPSANVFWYPDWNGHVPTRWQAGIETGIIAPDEPDGALFIPGSEFLSAVAAVPEPSWALLAILAAGAAFQRRRSPRK